MSVRLTGRMADVFDPDLARAAVELILEGQEPPFEGRVRERMDEARWFDSAEELVGAGVDYFGPVARKARRPLAGFSKEDVADATNVVWLDLDPPPGAGTEDGARLVAEAGRWLEGLRALGLGPSVFVFSGRGCWAYWKLDRHVPQREAELLMRRLYALFRPGGSEHDIGRVARMPGSVNEKTGLRAFVVWLEEARWGPRELARLLPDIDVAAVSDTNAAKAEYDRALKPGGRLPRAELPDDLLAYMAARPPKRQRAAEGIDGSARGAGDRLAARQRRLLGRADRALLRPPPAAPPRGGEAQAPQLRLARHGHRQRPRARRPLSPLCEYWKGNLFRGGGGRGVRGARDRLGGAPLADPAGHARGAPEARAPRVGERAVLRQAQPGAPRARLARDREGVHRRGPGRGGPADQADPPDRGGPPAARVVEVGRDAVRVPEGPPGPGRRGAGRARACPGARARTKTDAPGPRREARPVSRPASNRGRRGPSGAGASGA